MTAEFKSCNGCTRETNNANFDCPVKGDYRFVTNWTPRCAAQYQDMINHNLSSSLDYRMYLTHNADELIQNNAQNAYMKYRCGPCVDNPSWNDGTMLREFDSQTCNARTCSFNVSDPFGLGRQRKYYTDDSDKAMNKEFIQSKEKENNFFKNSVECCGTSQDELAYYPIGGGTQQNYNRHAVPSGGALMKGGDNLKVSQ